MKLSLVLEEIKESGIDLAYKMNINKITYNKNECADKRKKNLFVTIINFSSFLKKGLFYKKGGNIIRYLEYVPSSKFTLNISERE